MSQKLHTLANRVFEFANYLEGVEREGPEGVKRDEVMRSVHSLNEAYWSWADEVDTKELLDTRSLHIVS